MNGLEEEEDEEIITEEDQRRENDLSDVYFLIADFLRRATPCTRTAQVLEEELHSLGLLHHAIDWQGQERRATYTDIHLQHQELPPTQLVHLLRQGSRGNDASLLKRPPAVISTSDERRVAIHQLIRLWMQLRSNERKILRIERLLEKFTTMTTDIAEEERCAKQLRFLQRKRVQDQRRVSELFSQVRRWGMTNTKPYLGKNHIRHLLHRERTGRLLPQSILPSFSADEPPVFTYSRYRILKTLSGHLQISVYCVTFDKSGKYIITGSDDRLVKIWSARTGDLLYTLHGHVGNITDMDINADGTLLATSSDDKTLRVWEITSGFSIAVLVGHTSDVNTVRFHPNLNIIASASNDGMCLLFRLPIIEPGPLNETKMDTVQRLFRQNAYCLNVKPFLVLNHAVTSGASSTTVRLTRSCKVLCLDFSPCGTKIATGSQDGVARIWSVGSHILSSTATTTESTQDQIDAVVASIPESNPEPTPESNAVGFIPPAQSTQPTPGAANPAASPTPEPSLNPHLEHSTIIHESSLPLQGHTSPITNVFFSKQSDCVATQSIKDGTTRLWRWTTEPRKKLSVVHRILHAPEVMSGTRRQATHWSADMMQWTAKEVRLVTLHSRKIDPASLVCEQAIRIWDPITSSLVMTIRHPQKAHVNAVFAMEVHPTDWRILLTAGYDGRICLWDISTGQLLRQYQNYDQVGDPCLIYDVAFSPDGSLFTVTDRAGRLLIFGTGAGDSYKASPRDQYFANDYSAIEMDRNMNVRDRETQIQPHLMPRSVLMDMERTVYAQQPLYLMLDSIALEDYNANYKSRREQYKQLYQANLEGVANTDNTNFEPYQCLIEKLPVVAERPSSGNRLATTQSYRISGEPVLASEVRSAQRRPPRNATTSVDDRDTSVLNDVLPWSSDEDRDEDFQVPNAALDEDDDEDEDDEEMGELVDDESNRGDESGSDTPPRIYTTADGTRALRSRRRESEENMEQAPRRRRLRKRDGRQLLDGPSSGDEDEEAVPGQDVHSAMPVNEENEPDIPHEEEDGATGSSKNQLDKFDKEKTFTSMLAHKRKSDPNAQILCGFCGRGDVGSMVLPGETLGNHPLINGAQRVFVHDQCAIASPQSFYEKDHWYNLAKELRRGWKLKCNACGYKGATIGCNNPSCNVTMHFHCAMTTGWQDQDTYYCRDHQHMYVPTDETPNHQLRAMKAQLLKNKVSFEESFIKRQGYVYDRFYCQQVVSQPEQYNPQVGDVIVYCPQGHEFYLRFAPSKYQPAYMRFPQRYAVVQCRIVDITYTFPLVETYVDGQRILMQLHLEVLGIPSFYFHEHSSDDPCRNDFNNFVPVNDHFEIDESPTRDHFRFLLHTQPNDCPDFILLHAKYALGFVVDWAVGDEVQSTLPSLDIHGVQCDSVVNNGVIKAKQRKDADFDSPWECLSVLFDDDEQCPINPWELEPGTPEARLLQTANAPPVPSIDDEKRAALLRGFASIMQLSVSLDFVHPVPESTADYHVTVANPMDLSLIRNRIEHSYYRQVEALLADVQLILTNCEKYNIESSQIVQNARSLVQATLAIIRQSFPLEVAAWEERHHSAADQFAQETSLLPPVEETKRPVGGVKRSGVGARVPPAKRQCSDDVAVVQKLKLSMAQRQQWLQRLAKGSLAAHLNVLHRAIQAEDIHNIFAAPVTDDIAPGYSSIIPNPMDFGTMQSKMNFYGSFAAYHEDMMLVFENAMVYNEEGSFVHSEALRIKGLLGKCIGTILKGKAKAAPPKRKRPSRNSFDMNDLDSDEASFASSELEEEEEEEEEE
ncbi:hypothetical protein THRCLA_01069, partial [Thraustotheca clavata]